MSKDEEKKEETPKEEESKSSEEESPTEPISKLEQAEKIVERQEAANKESKELVERMEKAKAEEILSGRANAGSVPKPKVDDDTQAKLDANKTMEGTGMMPYPELVKKEEE